MSPLALSLRFLQAQPDGRLAELASQGHEAAFEALVRRYRNELLSYCRRLTPEAANAEDALQQALLQAWKALKAGAEIRDIRAWLYRIAHNVAISHLRAAGATTRQVDDVPGSFDLDQLVQQRLRARAALAEMALLPDLQRRVLVSTTLDGASHEEVATALGLSNGAIRGLIYRARAALRAAAAAVIPTPVLSWAIRNATARSKRTHAVVEAVVGGGGAGMAGIIAKGGALVAITGAVAGGATIVSPTTPHQHHNAASQADLPQAGGSSLSVALLAQPAQGASPGSRSSNTSASTSGEGRSSPRSGRDASSDSTGGSSGASTSGHDGDSSGGSRSGPFGGSDGGSFGGSDGGSRGGSTGSSNGRSDGDSSLATITQSSGDTRGGSTGDSRTSSNSGSSDGGGPTSSASDGGVSGTSGGQVTTATSTSSGTSGLDGGSSASSGSGDTTTTTAGTH